MLRRELTPWPMDLQITSLRESTTCFFSSKLEEQGPLKKSENNSGKTQAQRVLPMIVPSICHQFWTSCRTKMAGCTSCRKTKTDPKMDIKIRKSPALSPLENP